MKFPRDDDVHVKRKVTVRHPSARRNRLGDHRK